MNRSRALIPFILISLGLHALLVFLALPAAENVARMPLRQKVAVGLVKKAEPPQPEIMAPPEPQAAAEPERASAPRELPVREPEPEPEPEPVTIPEPQPAGTASEESNLPAPEAEVEPASGAAEAAGGEESQDQPVENPFADLIRRINSLKDSTYPLKAKKRGYQGTVVVEVNIDAGGNLISSAVIRKSGYSILDAAALELIAGVLEQPYLHHTGNAVILRIPISYRLL